MVNLELASRRNKKAVSLEEISQATKISIRSLQAIEAGEFQKLPGGVYNTSYIRQYARAIDVDESQILEFYYSVMGIRPEPQKTLEQARATDAGFVSRFIRHTSTVLGS
jgi:cytoskeletal protein RodZ